MVISIITEMTSGTAILTSKVVFSARDRDFQIEKINRDFDHKVEAIQCDPYLRRREKRMAIRKLNLKDQDK